MHADNIEWADQMEEWKNDPANRKISKAGDDRSPAFRWLGCLYHDGEHVCIPQDNLMRSFMEGGAMVPVPGGRSGKTFKAQTQSGMNVGEPAWKLAVNGKEIEIAPLFSLMNEPDFGKHKEAAKAQGFSLHIKRAKIGASKHVRVRPIFHNWTASGTIVVWDEQITTQVLTDILTYAGKYKGIGDWRPGAKTPGSFGMFEASIKEI
jgi:hypothetical protein